MGGAAAVVLAALACSPSQGPTAPSPGAAEPAAATSPQSEREAVLGPFLSAHWRLPVVLQGAPPAGFSEADASLDPAVCGACHPRQHAEWKGSLHAAAFSPGLAGQILTGGPLSAPADARSCQTCHAPLGEQQELTAAGMPNAAFDPALRAQGLVCAGCHVRAHRRFGPPRRPDAPPPPDLVPHGGFEVRPEYLESRFCAACHQFFDDPGVAGKPLENTYAEWRESPQAAEGKTCQSCHMPDRAHLWRGIHDPEMVRRAVDVELVPTDLASSTLEATLVLRSRDVGHAFPTYVTPRVYLALWQVDAEGRELPPSRVQAVIGREVDFGTDPWREIFDTRVAPGESVRLDYAKPREADAVALVARVTVDPDFHYRGVFEALLASLEAPAAREAIREAVRRVSNTRYVLSETRRPLPHGPG